jgi:hypothetical protein
LLRCNANYKGKRNKRKRETTMCGDGAGVPQPPTTNKFDPVGILAHLDFGAGGKGRVVERCFARVWDHHARRGRRRSGTGPNVSYKWTATSRSVIILLVPGSEVVGMGCKLQLLRPLLRKCHHWREHYNERCTCLGDRAVLRIDNKVRHSSPPGSIQVSNVASQTPEPSDWKGLHHA